ncbi:MAG: MATE family efflux transporter [Spirochaetales bacterium]|nr:MATE family efflux transporter [Spirochaetales bacterium]
MNVNYVKSGRGFHRQGIFAILPPMLNPPKDPAPAGPEKGLIHGRKDRAELSLLSLALPMYLENLFRTTLQSVDVFMLSSYSDKAVAAVGLISNFSFFLFILYNVVAIGSSILISQHLGAGQQKQANTAALSAYVMGTGFALIISLGLGFSAGSILKLYSLEDEVYTYARQYLTIFGFGSVFLAFGIIQGSILRSYGYAKEVMAASMIANVVNVIGNAVSIYGLFGLPVFGVPGVAVSTVGSHAVSCVIVAFRIRAHKDIHIPLKHIAGIPRSFFNKMLKIGIPSAGENLSYNMYQMIITGLIALSGTAALTANVYVLTIARFVFMPAMSIGFAVQIKAGYLAGAGHFDEAKKKVFLYTALGYGISAVLVSVLYLLKRPVMGIFTHDQDILNIAYLLITIAVFREIGRVTNIIVIPALKGTGDVIFPVIIGIIFQWCVGAGGAFLSVYVFDAAYIGIWLAMAADEWLRSIIMLMRWSGGAWKKKRLIDVEEE